MTSPLVSMITRADWLLPLLAALSVMGVIVALAWPLLGVGQQRRRALALTRETLAIKTEGRQKLVDKGVESLRKAISRRTFFDMLRQVGRVVPMRDTAAVALRLQQAGFRSASAASMLMALKLFLAFVLPVLGYFYLEAVMHPTPSTLVQAAAVIASAAGGFFLPDVLLSNQINKRRQEIRRFWPDVLDLLIICVEGGLSVEAAIRRVAGEISAQSPVLAEELSITSAELAYLKKRNEAYERMAQRIELPVVNSVAMTLIQAEKYGTPVGKALAVLARETRVDKLNTAEKHAASLGPKLTVPMIVFFLPVLFAVIIAPVLMQVMK